MTIPLPTSTTTTTSGASGATVTTVTVDIDLASALTWRGPRITGSFPYQRRPWEGGIVEQFPGTLTGNSDKIIPTGSYVADGGIRIIYAAAASAVARAGGGWVMPFTQYITRKNASLSFTRLWAPLDSAGVTALQPGFGPTLLGYGSRLFFTLPTLPSWAVPHNGIFSDQQKVSGSLFAPLLQASNSFGFWYQGSQQLVSPFPATPGGASSVQYDLITCNPSGMTGFVWCNLVNWTTGGATPTLSVDFQWYDAYGVAIGSPTTYGPWTTTNPVSGGGITTTGLAQDFALGTLTPPANARVFTLTWNVNGTFINYGQVVVSLRGYDPMYAGVGIAPEPYPKYRIDAGGFVPGVLIKP